MAADDQITEILRTAHESVKAAGVPSTLEETAFENAVALLAARSGLGIAASTAPEPAPQFKPALASGQAAGPTAEKTLARLAEKLKVKTETIDEVFHIENDDISLSFGTGKLESAKSKAAKQIALLVAASRQAGGWDAEWTTSAAIREVCEQYGKFDSGNFASTLKEMDDVFSFSGSGSSRKVKVKRKGYEDAAALVNEIAGEKTP